MFRSSKVELDAQDLEDMRRLAEGDSEALGSLYDRHASALCGVGVKMLRDRVAAEDVVHDVFVEVWRKAGSYRSDRGRVKTWLMVRMRSRCLDRLRRSSHRERSTEVTPEGVAPASQLQTADADRARRALDLLSEDQRRVISLSYFGGLTSLEISEQLGIAQGTVKSRLRTGLEKMRSALANTHAPPREGASG